MQSNAKSHISNPENTYNHEMAKSSKIMMPVSVFQMRTFNLLLVRLLLKMKSSFSETLRLSVNIFHLFY